MNKLFYLLFLSIFVACSQPEPKPELRDPIYQDYVEQKGIFEKSLIEVEAQMKEHEKSLKEAIPQTGQNKWATKRYWEAKNNYDKLKQQIEYFNVKILERAKYVRRNYIDKFQKGETWENKAEFEEYKAEKKLRSAKFTWDLKKRMEEAGVDTGKEEKGGKKEKAEGEKKAEH